MNIKISSVHFDADKKLLDFIESRVSKLAKFYEDIIGAEVVLRIDKSQDQENKLAEIKLIVPNGGDLFAKKQTKSFEESTDSVIEALQKQITKHKEKIRGN